MKQLGWMEVDGGFRRSFAGAGLRQKSSRGIGGGGVAESKTWSSLGPGI